MQNRQAHRSLTHGFTLVELLVVVAIIGIILAGVMSQINTVVQRSSTEQSKVDDFEEARDFVDQFFRDINQIGYPNIRMVDTTSPSFLPPLANPIINDNRFGIGLVKIDATEIRFEADTNGNGSPQSLIYKLNGSGTCANCLQRSQVAKVVGDPLNGQSQNWGTEVNDVISNPIFSYFRANSTPITVLPVDISTAAGAQTIASIKTIQISLTIQNPNVIDPKTGQPIQTTFQGEVSLNNCSMAAAGQPMSC